MSQHTPDTLYKYCSVETAKAILSTKSLRWHSPCLFNDPLELTHDTEFEFDGEQLLRSTIKLSTSMIFAREFPKGDTPLINAIRRWREEERFGSPDEAEGVLKDLLVRMVDARLEGLAELRAQWVNYHKRIRISTYCGKPDNILAWSKYGDQHRGVCFRFAIGEYNSVKKPVPVEYVNTRPEITTIKEQISAILYNTRDRSADKFEQKLLFKSPVFKQENEWRAIGETKNFSAVQDDPNTWYDDKEINGNDITGIYFGIDTSEDDIAAIAKLASDEFGKAKLFKTLTARGKYDLDTERLEL